MIRSLRSTVNRVFFAKAKPFTQFKQQEPQDQPVVSPKLKKEVDPSSVIKKFRRDVLEKSLFTKEEEDLDDIIRGYDKEIKDAVSKGTREQQLMNSRKLVERFVNQKQIFGNKAKDASTNNYAQYSRYKSGGITQQKVYRKDYESTQIIRGYKFLRELGPEYMQNQVIDETLEKNYQGQVTVEQYAKHMQDNFNKAKMLQYSIQDTDPAAPTALSRDRQDTTAWIEIDVSSEEEDVGEIFDDHGERKMVTYNGQNNLGRLSPMACETILKLYLEGWTVKDISMRFGIHPRRTKFVVWCRAQYYLQILPKMGFEHFRDRMFQEMKYGQETGYMDYGIDLNVLRDETKDYSQRITTWNNRMVDIKGDTDVDRERKRLAAIQIMEKSQGMGTNRHQKVLLGYFGKQNKLTEMRDWKIFRAKGSEYYHTKFKTFRSLAKKQGRHTYK